MTKVILDQAAIATLTGVIAQVEVCDEFGRTMGYFHPVINPSNYPGAEPPFSTEDLDRFEQEAGGRSLQEILGHLERRV